LESADVHGVAGDSRTDQLAHLTVARVAPDPSTRAESPGCRCVDRATLRQGSYAVAACVAGH
jgi:hypothetical protein